MGQYYIKVLLIMVVLVAFILPGFLLRKCKLLQAESLTSLSNILLYVCQPLMFVKAFCVRPIQPSWQVGKNMLFVFLVALVGMILVYLLCRVLFRKSKDRKRTDVYTFIAVFSNCGFIGIPFVDMLTDGNSEATMYVIVFNVAFNFLVWTLGVYLMTQNPKDVSLKNAFLNPSVIAVAFSLLLFLIPQINIFNMEAVAPLQQIAIYLGEMTAPLSMLIVGARAADLSLKDIFVKNPKDYISAALRLIIAPAVLLLLVLPFKAMGILGADTFAYSAPVIAMAMTPASTAVAYAEKFNGDRLTAARAFISGTLLGVITIPLVITLVSIL